MSVHLPARIAPDLGRWHRKVPLVRHDPGRGTGVRQKARSGVRREDVRHHRDDTGRPPVFALKALTDALFCFPYRSDSGT